MRLLLDTHIAIWAIVNDRRLSAEARSAIEGSENEIFVSAASIWEIAIKYPLRRGGSNDMPISGSEAVGYFEAAGFTLLAISPAHATAIDRLEPLHGDPFDRLLLAQALHEPMKLLTRDAKLSNYGAMVILV